MLISQKGDRRLHLQMTLKNLRTLTINLDKVMTSNNKGMEILYSRPHWKFRTDVWPLPYSWRRGWGWGKNGWWNLPLFRLSDAKQLFETNPQLILIDVSRTNFGSRKNVARVYCNEWVKNYMFRINILITILDDRTLSDSLLDLFDEEEEEEFIQWRRCHVDATRLRVLHFDQKMNIVWNDNWLLHAPAAPQAHKYRGQ